MGLDMLTKHYAEAIGFDVVFFLPDSEDDFASYTEFLRYLGAKNRAGVAKFDDGMTLFLVPPSDFLTKVLKVAGPERLYGVVLKFPQQVPGSGSMQQQSHLPIPSSQYIERQHIPPSQAEYGVIPSKDERVLQMDYSRVLPEEPKLPSKPHFPPANDSSGLQSVAHDYAPNSAAAMSQAGVSLTPELIATLASLLPANAQTSAPEGAKPSGSSTITPTYPSVAPYKVTPSPGWKQDHHQTSDHTGHALQQLGSQFNSQGQNLSQFQPYPSVSNVPGHSAQSVLGNTQFQDSAVGLSQQATVSSRPPSSFPVYTQAGQVAASQHLTQYQVDGPSATQKGYGIVHGTDASGLYNSPVSQPLNNSMAIPSQSYNANAVQSQTLMPLPGDKVNADVPNQVQQLQSALLGAGQSTSEGEVDKNQRYQSTLQFAASLLLQIQQQQQQQQVGTQAGRGSGGQQ